MTFSTAQNDESSVLSIGGELDALSVSDLKPVLDELTSAAPKSIIVELSQLRLIDSWGVAAIISLYKRAVAGGKTARVQGARDQPLAILRLLRLDRVLM